MFSRIKFFCCVSAVGLRTELFLLDWIMTLFGKAVPLDLACR
jgi:hypothetical protein